MFIMIYIQDKVFKWIQSYLKNILSKQTANRKININKIFSIFALFKKYVKRMFKDINVKRTVKQELINL